MITYTKKNVSLLALVFTILIFMFFNFQYFLQFIKEIPNTYAYNQVYSKVIPNINKNATVLKTNFESQTNLNQELNESVITNLNQELNQNDIANSNIQNKKTQRQVIQENKESKWRIQIPKINLDVHIKEGTSSNILLQSVGHFEETSKWNGNIGLAAHNRGYNCNFFQNIKKLKVGDEIIYTTNIGKKVYQVQTNKIIAETDWSYLEQTKENCITLITCEENRKEYRRCIQAIEIAGYLK